MRTSMFGLTDETVQIRGINDPVRFLKLLGANLSGQRLNRAMEALRRMTNPPNVPDF